MWKVFLFMKRNFLSLWIASLLSFLSGCGPSSSNTSSLPTTCPEEGRGLAAVMSALAPGQDQALFYTLVEGYSGRDDPALHKSIIKRYNPKNGKTVDVLALEKTAIWGERLSTDGQWIIFVARQPDQDSIQMVRIDGQQQQTLFCAKSIGHTFLSPDQKKVIFNTYAKEGDKLLIEGVYVLDLTDGTIKPMLASPMNLVPRAWIDNNRILLIDQDFFLAVPHPLLVLDLDKGERQQEQSLSTLAVLPAWGHLDFSADRTELIIVEYSKNEHSIDPAPPSTITAYPFSGGPPRTILTSETLGITHVHAASDTTLLFLVEKRTTRGNYPYVYNEFWRVNVDGSQLTRLTTEPAGTPRGYRNFVSAFPNGTWDNVSRDGTLYSGNRLEDPLLDVLFVGSMDGGSLDTFASVDLEEDDLSLIGWTVV